MLILWISSYSCWPVLPRLPAAGALTLEALKGRQCALLRDCGSLGRLQRRLVHDALCPRLADAQESHGGGPVAATRHQVPRNGNYVRSARIYLRISENNRLGDSVDRCGAAVRESGDQVGGAAEGHVPEQGEFDSANSNLMTVSELGRLERR